MTAADQTAPPELRIHPAADLAALRGVSDQAAAFVADHGASREAVFRIRLVVEELLDNVIRFGGAGAAPIEVAVRVVAGVIAIEITDHGRPFDPSGFEPPELPTSADDVRPGDMGLRLVKNLVGKPVYRREDGCNIVSLKFSLAGD